MDIQFFEDPLEGPRPRNEVKIERLGLYLYPDKRRVAVGFELTPFRERPSIDVRATNGRGEPAGSMTIIETLSTNFTLTLHLRDADPTDSYEIQATVYYASPETERQDVFTMTATLDATQIGDQSAT